MEINLLSFGQIADITGRDTLKIPNVKNTNEDAIDACEEIVERIKKEVPVWGKEIFGNESFQWKINT